MKWLSILLSIQLLLSGAMPAAAMEATVSRNASAQPQKLAAIEAPVLPVLTLKSESLTSELSGAITAQVRKLRTNFLDQPDQNLERLIEQAYRPIGPESSRKQIIDVQAAQVILHGIGNQQSFEANEKTFKENLDKTAFESFERSSFLIQNAPQMKLLLDRAQQVLGGLTDALHLALPEQAAAKESGAYDSAAENSNPVETPATQAVSASFQHSQVRTQIPGRHASKETPDSELGPGDVVGEWKLEKKLGQGGFAEAWLANRVSGAQEKALLKIGNRPEFKRFLRREIKRRRRLGGKWRVIEANLKATRPYIAVKHVEGKTLREIVKERGRLPFDELLWLIELGLHDLNFMHSQGVIHMDVTPDNLIVDKNGNVHLIDLGLARVIESPENFEEVQKSRTFRTVDGEIAGTPTYASPEQSKKELLYLVSPSSDVYPWAMMFYELAFVAPGKTDESKELFNRITPVMAKAGEKDPLIRQKDFPDARALLDAIIKAREGAKDEVKYAPLNLKRAVERGQAIATLTLHKTDPKAAEALEEALKWEMTQPPGQMQANIDFYAALDKRIEQRKLQTKPRPTLRERMANWLASRAQQKAKEQALKAAAREAERAKTATLDYNPRVLDAIVIALVITLGLVILAPVYAMVSGGSQKMKITEQEKAAAREKQLAEQAQRMKIAEQEKIAAQEKLLAERAQRIKILQEGAPGSQELVRDALQTAALYATVKPRNEFLRDFLENNMSKFSVDQMISLIRQIDYYGNWWVREEMIFSIAEALGPDMSKKQLLSLAAELRENNWTDRFIDKFVAHRTFEK